MIRGRPLFNPPAKPAMVTRDWREARALVGRAGSANAVCGVLTEAEAEAEAEAEGAEARQEGQEDESDSVEEVLPVITPRRTRSGRLIAMTAKAQAAEAKDSVDAVAVVAGRTRQRGISTLQSVSLPSKKRSRKNTQLVEYTQLLSLRNELLNKRGELLPYPPNMPFLTLIPP